jgi:hypothetical protein
MSRLVINHFGQRTKTWGLREPTDIVGYVFAKSLLNMFADCRQTLFLVQTTQCGWNLCWLCVDECVKSTNRKNSISYKECSVPVYVCYNLTQSMVKLFRCVSVWNLYSSLFWGLKCVIQCR